MAALETGFHDLVMICIHLIELAGIVVIVVSMIRALIDFIRKKDSTRIELAQGIMLGLDLRSAARCCGQSSSADGTSLARWERSFCCGPF